MSRLHELITELCPEGVPFKAVGEIAAKGANIKWATTSDEEFQYIDLTSVNRVTRKIGETATITAKDAPNRAQQIVQTGDVIFATTRPTQMRLAMIPPQYDGQIASTGYCVLRPDTSIMLTNFLAHILGADTFKQYIEINQVAGNYPSIPDSRVRAHRIPVPPLEVQREIVQILDKFTKLEDKLEAELEARRQQYEHYLHKILAVANDTDWVKLGEATKNHDRKRKPVTRSDRRDGEYPYYGANGIQDYVDDYIFDGTYLLIGEDGSVKQPDGTPVLNWATGKIWVNNHAHVLSSADERFNLRYLFHYLKTVDISAHVTGGTQPKLNQRNLNQIPVPLLARSKQDRIAALLDKFDALANDPNVGLPAELSVRRKQYEYYRDRLLKFEETAV